MVLRATLETVGTAGRPVDEGGGERVETTRVLIVDDHQLVRAGLASLIGTCGDLEVVGEASDGDEAVEQVGRTHPHVVLMDLSMPVMDGVTATREVTAAYPDVHVVVLTSVADRRPVREALDAGAVGYLLKDCDPRDLLAGVRAAAVGNVPLDPRVARTLLPDRSGAQGSALSTREEQVLRLVAEGMPNKQIGRRLGIAEHTVKVHLGSVFRRIGVSDRTSAALWAREHLPAERAQGR